MNNEEKIIESIMKESTIKIKADLKKKILYELKTKYDKLLNELHYFGKSMVNPKAVTEAPILELKRIDKEIDDLIPFVTWFNNKYYMQNI